MPIDLELRRSFFLESEDLLERLDSELTRLFESPQDVELINSIFRGLHTIKGNSSFLALDNITTLSHSAEALLDKARRQELTVSRAFCALVRKVLEDLHVLIVEQETDFDVSSTVAKIQVLLVSQAAVSPTAPRGAADPVRPPITKTAIGSYVRVDEAKISKIISLVGELEILRYTLEKFPDRMEVLGRPASDIRFDLDLQVSKISRLTKSLSGLMFGVRLVPVNQVFQRFPRVVRELAAKLGKEIRLEVVNGEAELDKSIVEAITDPMTHLIRNSADHGIESVEDRLAAGKPREGVIKLNSYVRGNFVYIEIADDGRGIDGDKVLAKAVKMGVVPSDKIASFTESKKLGLIFAPGFSMAEKVTDISGRGVGMDVVKSNINQLKGTVIIDSNVGQGTVIQLRFPMSLMVMFSLFVEINNIFCAIAVDQVNESMDYSPRELLGQLPANADAGEYLAVFSLQSLLWGEEEELGQRKSYHTLRFKDPRGKNMAFIVDEFSSLEEAIVQSVDSYIAALPGIQGATIRKDGSVGLMLNVENVMERALKAKPFAYVKVHEKKEVDTSSLTDFLEFAQTG